MAAWQASLHVILPTGALPSDYAERIGSLLPLGRHWDHTTRRWGLEDGDMIDVSVEPAAEIFVRFDLRSWRPDLYEGLATFVRDVGGRLQDAETNADVTPTPVGIMDNLRGSRAARFVRDPEAYFQELRKHPIRIPDEP